LTWYNYLFYDTSVAEISGRMGGFNLPIPPSKITKSSNSILTNGSLFEVILTLYSDQDSKEVHLDSLTYKDRSLLESCFLGIISEEDNTYLINESEQLLKAKLQRMQLEQYFGAWLAQIDNPAEPNSVNDCEDLQNEGLKRTSEHDEEDYIQEYFESDTDNNSASQHTHQQKGSQTSLVMPSKKSRSSVQTDKQAQQEERKEHKSFPLHDIEQDHVEKPVRLNYIYNMSSVELDMVTNNRKSSPNSNSPARVASLQQNLSPSLELQNKVAREEVSSASAEIKHSKTDKHFKSSLSPENLRITHEEFKDRNENFHGSIASRESPFGSMKGILNKLRLPAKDGKLSPGLRRFNGLDDVQPPRTSRHSKDREKCISVDLRSLCTSTFLEDPKLEIRRFKLNREEIETLDQLKEEMCQETSLEKQVLDKVDEMGPPDLAIEE
jgi:hypothetical protein